MLAGVLVASFPVPMSHDVCGNRALEKCLQNTIVCRFMMQFCRCSVKYVTLSDSVRPLSAAAQLVQIMPLLLDWLWGGAHVDHEQAGALSKVSLVHVYISLHFYCFWSAQGPWCHVGSTVGLSTQQCDQCLGLFRYRKDLATPRVPKGPTRCRMSQILDLEASEIL